MAFDIVVFDLDGTLADTAADLAEALNQALVQIGRQRLPVDQIRLMVGHGTRALMRKGIAATGGGDETLVEAGLAHLLSWYAAHICRHTTAYPGVTDTLKALRARDIHLGICTNKPEHLARALVAALGWSALFDVVVGGDTLAVTKPDAAPLLHAIACCGGGRTLYVGDSITDADTARAAHVPFVAVSFGFRDRPVDQLGADGVIDAFAQLPAMVDRLGAA